MLSGNDERFLFNNQFIGSKMVDNNTGLRNSLTPPISQSLVLFIAPSFLFLIFIPFCFPAIWAKLFIATWTLNKELHAIDAIVHYFSPFHFSTNEKSAAI
jgi:hypothetical protein